MTTPTNELDGYSPMPTAGMDVSLTLDQGGEYGDSQTVSVAEPDPVTIEKSSDIAPESVYLYAEGIQTASAGESDTDMVHFDITFNVTCTTPDTGISHTFKVVKRIAVDKMKLATEAKQSTPVTVVESKKEQSVLSETTARWKQIAGLK